MILLFILLLGTPLLISLIDLIGYFIKGKRIVHVFIVRIAEIGSFLLLPYFYITIETKNNCCTNSAVFAFDHRLTIIVLSILCTLSYFYCQFRNSIAPPVVEVLVNCLLLIGIVLNVFIAIHTQDAFFASLGNGPILIFGILTLAKNQKLFLEQTINLHHNEYKNQFEIFAWKVLHLSPIIKYPVVFLLCLPILMVISCFLMLFGQKPDSLIRAFTETYKHGFSQWDWQCENVMCGGHYLCSVAANGHAKYVKPERLGIRNGNYIVCNRQLLIANAFEELVQERMPSLHKCIRRQYNKVGDLVHRYYFVFENKLISDIIYFFMKPAEWLFLLILYTFDRNPENRISKQYLSSSDRSQID